jgi:hypothetical protein
MRKAGYEPRPSTLHFDLGISSVHLGWASTTTDIGCCIEHRTWSSKHCTRLDLIIREETTDRLTISFGVGMTTTTIGDRYALLHVLLRSNLACLFSLLARHFFKRHRLSVLQLYNTGSLPTCQLRRTED